MFKTRKDTVFVILAGIFITNAVVAEMIGGKLIQVGPYVMSIGILPWPVVFISTDLINEYFGVKGVRKLSAITACLIAYCFFVLYFAIQIPAANGIISVSDEQFRAVFGQSMWIIVGSIIAFVVSQMVDVGLFHFVKSKTGEKMIWLRSTGSTVISQFFDTYIVLGIAFWMTGKMSTEVYLTSGLIGYVIKLVIAIVLTPIIYIGHYIIEKYLHTNVTDSRT